MSTNVALIAEADEQKIVPVVLTLRPVDSSKPDWDKEAGVTGALEGYADKVVKLKPIQYKALSLLLAGHTQSQVASEIGVTRRTISRWMRVGTVFREILMDRQPLPIHQNKLTWGLVGEAAFAGTFFDPGLQQIALDAPLPADLERRKLALTCQSPHGEFVQFQILGDL